MMLLGYLSVGLFLTTVGANNIAHLVGTWTTKSRKVITGPVCEMDKQLLQTTGVLMHTLFVIGIL